MSLVARARSLWRNVVLRSRIEAELDEELGAYVEQLVAEQVRTGVPEAVARRRARLQVGGVDQVKDSVRDARAGALLDALRQDLRYAMRTLGRAPAFTATALAALALGIGATVAIFSVVHAVLLRPLPYARPGQLVLVAHERTAPVAPANFLDWQREARAFAQMAAAQSWASTMGGETPERVRGIRVSAGALALTGVRPAIGREAAVGADGEPAAELVVSWGFWQRRLAGDAAALGRTLMLDGEPYTVVGVMPAGFDFPIFWARDVEVWGPLPLAGQAARRHGQSLRVFGRLRDGVSLEQARRDVAALTGRLEAQFPGTNRDVTVTPLGELVVGDVRPALLVLLGAVALLLLIACANVAHMQLARAAERTRELTVRTALGASRARIVRQLLTESLLLAIAGGALGVLLAHVGTRSLVALAADSLPRAGGIGISPAVLAFALVVSVATGVAFGLAPARRAGRADVAQRLRDGGRGVTAGADRVSLRGMLTVSQVALALLLLAGAGLLARSFAALRAVDPGFEAAGVLSVQVSTTGTPYAEPARRVALFDELVRRVGTLPGVAQASAVNHLPLAGDEWGQRFTVEGAPPADPAARPRTVFRVAYPGYFETLRIPLLRGRGIGEQDRLGSTPVVVVNRWFAERHWPGQDPIGRRITTDDPADDPEWLTVVGVVENVAISEWAAAPREEIYRPYHQTRGYVQEAGGHVSYLTLVVRAACAPGAACDAASLATPVRAAARALAPGAPVTDVQTLAGVVRDENAQPRFNAILLALFAAVALALAAVGIYGVMSYAVARRTHEIGLRMALGARAVDVQRLVVGRAMALTLLGTALGTLGALALARLMTGMLYGVGPSDPVTYVGAAVVLAAVALAACALPAWRASRVAPMTALRSD